MFDWVFNTKTGGGGGAGKGHFYPLAVDVEMTNFFKWNLIFRLNLSKFFRGLFFRGFRFQGTTFRGFCFQGTVFPGYHFSRTFLPGTIFRGCYFRSPWGTRVRARTSFHRNLFSRGPFFRRLFFRGFFFQGTFFPGTFSPSFISNTDPTFFLPFEGLLRFIVKPKVELKL